MEAASGMVTMVASVNTMIIWHCTVAWSSHYALSLFPTDGVRASFFKSVGLMPTVTIGPMILADAEVDILSD